MPRDPAQVLHAAIKAEQILSRWLAHQYGPQEQYTAMREARDALRTAVKE